MEIQYNLVPYKAHWSDPISFLFRAGRGGLLDDERDRANLAVFDSFFLPTPERHILLSVS